MCWRDLAYSLICAAVGLQVDAGLLLVVRAATSSHCLGLQARRLTAALRPQAWRCPGTWLRSCGIWPSRPMHS